MAPRSKARSLRSRIPLRHRLPNPSAVFVGREDEIAWLTTTLERAPVAVLCGPGGVGKTALVLRTLQTAFPERRERTLYLAIPSDEPPDQVRLALAHLLARAAGAEDTVDIAGLRGDPEELTATALDLAEEGPFWVVLDDLQHTDREEMGELLRQLSAYARESRFIATTRAPLSTDLDGQVLALSRMGHGALAEMARALEPKASAADLQAAVNAAVGSPWLLKQYLAAGAEGLALSRAGVLESVSDSARSLLETLSHLEVPLPREIMATLAPLPGEEELATLVARGLLVDEDGLRVHDQVGDFLFPPGTSGEAERRGRIAEQLSSREEPEALLEGLRLHGLAGDVEAIVTLLDERGHELMGLGYAPRVWQLVERTTDPRVSLWQLRCAAELGNATVLGAVREPRLPKGEDQLAWAATQFLLGEQEEARRIALEVAASGGVALEADARLLAARCLLHLGRAAEARTELDAASGAPAGALAALGALLDACLDVDGAVAETAAVGSRVSEAGDAEALLDVAMAHYRLGDPARADQVVEQVLATPRGGRAALLLSRRALLLRSRIAVDRGALQDARELLELVRPFARGTSILRPLLIEIDGARRLAVGELAGLEAALDRGIEVARGGEVSVSARLEMLAQELAERREGVGDGAGTSAPRPSASPWEPRGQRVLHEALHEARRELVAGDPIEGIEAARRAYQAAAHAGLRVLEAEALLLLGDGLFAALAFEELATVTEALTHLADSLGSPRLRHHAAFHEGHDDPAVLERLAGEEDVAPRVARRARALIGVEAALDGVDEQVLAAARTAWTDQEIVTLGDRAEAPQPAWGLDALRSAVWLPDGRTVPLVRKPLLFRVLSTLADHGGMASKETLINEAWDEREYHPIRHDPKLHVSIRALRKAIEDDPSQPERLLTTEEGYALGGVVRRVLPAE